jgi:hypothetical protein
MNLVDIELSPRDVCLAFAIAVMGFAFSGRAFLLYLNGLNSYQGFIIYYAIMYGSLYALSKLELIIFKPTISDIQGSAGMAMLLFSFFATINWENPYVQYVATGSFEGATGIFYQAEDGVCWLLATQVLGIVDIQMARIVAFSVIPFIVALVGLALIGGRVKVEV